MGNYDLVRGDDYRKVFTQMTRELASQNAFIRSQKSDETFRVMWGRNVIEVWLRGQRVV